MFLQFFKNIKLIHIRDNDFFQFLSNEGHIFSTKYLGMLKQTFHIQVEKWKFFYIIKCCL